MKCLYKRGGEFMSNAPKNASEKTFQENFVKELEKYK